MFLFRKLCSNHLTDHNNMVVNVHFCLLFFQTNVFFIKSTCWLVVLSVECGCIKMILIEGTVRDIEWIKCRLFYNLFKWTKHWTSNKHIKMENSILYDILSIVKLVTMFVMQCTYVLKCQRLIIIPDYFYWEKNVSL